MISKIFIATALFAVAVAQHNSGYGHGHAVSSQSIVLHHTHGHVKHAPVAHHAPAIAHEPVVHYQPTHHSGHEEHHGDHGHAVSSQNIVLHQTHGHVQHAPVAHHAPAVAHAPVVHHQPTHHSGHEEHHGDHGHAVSSQNVVVHQTHGHVQHAPVAHHAPAIAHAHTHHAGHEEHHAPAHYSFEYSVNDPHTGDIKSQHETREGDAVHGSYSLHEADGTVRRVEYTADKHSGFNAVVHREGKATHAAPVHHQPSHHSHH